MELPVRKHSRLSQYDYRENGYYFITICTKNHQELFSRIYMDSQGNFLSNQLTPMGKIAQSELCALEQRYPCIRIDKYVIMPNHIHVIFCLYQDQASEFRTSITDIICTYKSITARKCRQISHVPKVFQDSFYDHVIRNQQDYAMIWTYIDANPQRWKEDRFA